MKKYSKCAKIDFTETDQNQHKFNAHVQVIANQIIKKTSFTKWVERLTLKIIKHKVGFKFQ
jgi:hypothetical protein